jgi:hypothetical protein
VARPTNRQEVVGIDGEVGVVLDPDDVVHVSGRSTAGSADVVVPLEDKPSHSLPGLG